MIYRSSSSADTKAFARRVAAHLRKMKQGKRARVVALHGDLGAGKTTFVQGFAKAIGARGRVASPTFIIVRRMKIVRGPFRNLFHVDAYRIKDRREIAHLGFREMIADPQNIILIEWPERLGRSLPGGSLKLRFEHGKTINERIIRSPKNFS